MMRRARISVRPNVGRPGGRGLPGSQEGQAGQGGAAVDATHAAGIEGKEPFSAAAADAGQPVERTAETAAGMNNSQDSPPVDVPPNLGEEGHNGPTASSPLTATALQRRKRLSAMPNLSKPRVTPMPRTPKPPPPTAAAPPERPVPVCEDQEVDNSGAEESIGSLGVNVLGGQATSQGEFVPMLPVPSTSSCWEPTPKKEEKVAPSTYVQNTSQESESCSSTPLPKAPTSANRKPSLGSMTLEAGCSASNVPLKLAGSSADRQRIAKERKLKEMMQAEIKKERSQRKGKRPAYDGSQPLDHSKMTMRDLIYYLPETNPMTSSLLDEQKQEAQMIAPLPSKDGSRTVSSLFLNAPNGLRFGPEEKKHLVSLSPEKKQEVRYDDDDEEEDEEEEELLAPKVRVAEDGTLVLDEESLNVQVERAKTTTIVEGNDPIFERGSTTTYSSFRTINYSKPWSTKETDMFFLAISMVGTDFSMICQLFPHRTRKEVKNKFKREEKTNSWRIDKAFREKRPFDLEFFSSLLQLVLAADKKKKNKSNTKGSSGAKPKCKPKGKKAPVRKAIEDQASGDDVELDSDVAEGDSEMAEKENEDCSNVTEATGATKASRKCKRMKKEAEEDEQGPDSKIQTDTRKKKGSKKTQNGKKPLAKGTGGDLATSDVELDGDVDEGDSETAVNENKDCSNVVEAMGTGKAANRKRKRKTKSREGEKEEEGEGDEELVSKKRAEARKKCNKKTDKKMLSKGDQEETEPEGEAADGDCSNVSQSADAAAATRKTRKRTKNAEDEGDKSDSQKQADGRRKKRSKKMKNDEPTVCDLTEDDVDKAQSVAEEAEGSETMGSAVQEKKIQPVRTSRAKVKPNLGRGRAAKMVPEHGLETGEGNRTEEEDIGSVKVSNGSAIPEGKKAKRGSTVLHSDEEGPDEDNQGAPYVSSTQGKELKNTNRSGEIPEVVPHMEKAEREEFPSPIPLPLEAASFEGRGKQAETEAQQDLAEHQRSSPRSDAQVGHDSGEEGQDEAQREEEEQEKEEGSLGQPEEQSQLPVVVALGMPSLELVPEESDISTDVTDTPGPCETETTLHSEPSCEGAEEEEEEGMMLSEHHLDLLADVMEALSPHLGEGMESIERADDAARTLLTLNNPDLLCLSASAHDQDFLSTAEPTVQGPAEEHEPKSTLEQVDQSQHSNEPPNLMTSDFPVAAISEHVMQSLSIKEVSGPEPQTGPCESKSISEQADQSQHSDAPSSSVTSDFHVSAISEPAIQLPSIEEPPERALETGPTEEVDHLEETAATASAQNGTSSSDSFVPQRMRSQFPKPRPNLSQSQCIPRTPPLPNPAVPSLEVHGSPVAADTGSQVLTEEQRSGPVPVLTEESASKRNEEGPRHREQQDHEAESAQSGIPSSGSSTLSVLPGRRNRFPKPKPNLGLSTRTPHGPALKTPAASSSENPSKLMPNQKGLTSSSVGQSTECKEKTQMAPADKSIEKRSPTVEMGATSNISSPLVPPKACPEPTLGLPEPHPTQALCRPDAHVGPALGLSEPHNAPTIGLPETHAALTLVPPKVHPEAALVPPEPQLEPALDVPEVHIVPPFIPPEVNPDPASVHPEEHPGPGLGLLEGHPEVALGLPEAHPDPALVPLEVHPDPTLVPPEVHPDPALVPPEVHPNPALVHPEVHPGPALVLPEVHPGPALVPPEVHPGPALVPPEVHPGPALVQPDEHPGPGLIHPEEHPGPALGLLEAHLDPALVPLEVHSDPTLVPPEVHPDPALVPPEVHPGPALVPPEVHPGPALVPPEVHPGPALVPPEVHPGPALVPPEVHPGPALVQPDEHPGPGLIHLEEHPGPALGLLEAHPDPALVPPEACAGSASVPSEVYPDEALVPSEAHPKPTLCFPEANPGQALVPVEAHAGPALGFPEFHSEPTSGLSETHAGPTLVSPEVHPKPPFISSEAHSEAALGLPEASSEAAFTGWGSAGGRKTMQGALASLDGPQETTGLCTTGDPSTFVTPEGMEGISWTQDPTEEEPTFILTLFEIPPSEFGEYPAGTEALGPTGGSPFSPLILMDPQPGAPPSMSDQQNCESQSVKTSEEGSGCDLVSHLVLGDALVPVSEGQEKGTEQDWTDLLEQSTSTYPSETSGEMPSTSVMSENVESPAGVCEEHGSKTLVTESPEPVEFGTNGSNKGDMLSREKRKLPMISRRAKLQVRPCITQRKLRGSVKDKQGTLPEEPEQPGPAQTSPQTHQPTAPHPDAQQDSVEEAAAASDVSPIDQPAQGIVGCLDLLQEDRMVASGAENTENNSGAEGPPISHHSPLNRCESLSEQTVMGESGCVSVTHLVLSNVLVPVSEDHKEGTVQDLPGQSTHADHSETVEEMSSTAVTSENVESPGDFCEKDHGSHTLLVVQESHDSVDCGTDSSSQKDAVSTEKRKQPIRSRRAKLQVKPCITKRKLRGSVKDEQCTLPEEPEQPGPAQTSPQTHQPTAPHPDAQQDSVEEAAAASDVSPIDQPVQGIVACLDLLQEDRMVAFGSEGAETSSKGEDISYAEGLNSCDSQSVKTAEEGSGCDSVTHLVLSDVLIPVSEGHVEGTAQDWTDLPEQSAHAEPSDTAGEMPSTSVVKENVKVLADLSEEDHRSQTHVLVSESHDPEESGSDGPTKKDVLSQEKKKQPIRCRRAKLQVRPCITKRKLRGSVKNEQCTLPEEPEQPGPAQTSPQTHQPTAPHPDAQQDSVEEAAAASDVSPIDQPVQGIVGCLDLLQEDRMVASGAENTENNSGAEGPQISHDVTFNSCDSQSVKTAEEGSGCDSVSHLVLSDVLMPVSEGQVEGTAQEWTDLPEQNTHTDPSETAVETSSTAVMRATVKVLRDLGEDHGNQTVIIAESHDPVESRRDEPSETDPVSTEKRKQPIRSRRAKLQVKPCITKRELRGSVKNEQCTLPEEPEQPGPAQTSPQTHRPTAPHPDAQQDSVEEAAAASDVSPIDQPVQGIVGCSDLPQQIEEADRTEHSSGEKKLQPKWCSTPLKLSGKLTRPGGAPRGFLSFISGSGDSGPAAPSRTSRRTSLRPQVNTSCTGKKGTTEGAITKTSSDPSSLNTPPTKVSTTLHDTSAEPSSSEVPGPSQNEFLCSRTPEPDEEPTTVFQYCFTDIFTEVEEPN